MQPSKSGTYGAQLSLKHLGCDQSCTELSSHLQLLAGDQQCLKHQLIKRKITVGVASCSSGLM